jgi:hypothetical protein
LLKKRDSLKWQIKAIWVKYFAFNVTLNFHANVCSLASKKEKISSDGSEEKQYETSIFCELVENEEKKKINK